MKRLLFSLLFFSLVLKSIAQGYSPLIKENAQYFEHYLKSGPIATVESAWNLKISGDTIVNSLNYKKVYRRSMYSLDSTNFYYFHKAIDPNEAPVLYALLREDTVLRKVWGIVLDSNISFSGPFPRCGVQQEVLMYDYSLLIGDTLNLCLAGQFSDDTILNIGVDIPFGFPTKAFYYGGTQVYYEGIGSSIGLFDMQGIFLSGYSWNLYDYCVGTDSDCNVRFLSQDERENVDFQVFPNPTNNVVSIESKRPNKSKLKIYNSLGIQLLEITFLKHCEISVSNLEKGVYLISVNESKFKKLIVN